MGNFSKFQKPSSENIHFWKENLKPNFRHGKNVYCQEKCLLKNQIEKNQAENFCENFKTKRSQPSFLPNIWKFPIPSSSNENVNCRHKYVHKADIVQGWILGYPYVNADTPEGHHHTVMLQIFERSAWNREILGLYGDWDSIQDTKTFTVIYSRIFVTSQFMVLFMFSVNSNVNVFVTNH